MPIMPSRFVMTSILEHSQPDSLCWGPSAKADGFQILVGKEKGNRYAGA